MKKRLFLVGLLMAFLSGSLRFFALRQTPFANGWDSYFYLIQLKSWLETGRMHSPEASLIYPVLRAIYWFSNDYVLSFKICAALLAGVFTFAAFLLAFRWASNSGSAFLLAAWTVFSPHLTWFAGQYPKNLLGLIAFLAFLSALPLVNISKPKNWVLPLILLIFNYFCHRLTFGLAALSLGFHLIFCWLKCRGGLKHFNKKTALVLAFGAVAFLIFGKTFPGLFHFSDFERLGQWFGQIHFTPYLFVNDFGSGGRVSGWWMFEILVAVFCFIYLTINTLRGKGTPLGPILFSICGLLLWPFGEWSLTGFSFRFFLVFVLLAPVAFGTSDFRFWPPRRRPEGRQPKSVGPVNFAAPALLAAAFFSWKSYDPKLHDPNYSLFEKITKNATQHIGNQAVELVIAHNSLAEFFTFSTGVDAMPWLPEYFISPEKLWRIATDARLPELGYFTEKAGFDGQIFRLPGNYFLLREDHWQAILSAAKTENDVDFLERASSWKNPTRVRPEFLLRRK